LRSHALVEDAPAGAVLTPAGLAVADQLVSARRDELSEMLADHSGQREPEVQQLLERLSVELSGARP
jgi:hypothetical protein